MPPAIAAAGITAVGAIGGGILSANAQKKAASQAADTSLQVAQENNALAQQFRQENQANFQPFLNSGTQANSLLDSFLYGPGPTDYFNPTGGAAPSPAPTPATGTQTAPVVSQTPVPTSVTSPSTFAPSNIGIINTARNALLSPGERAARMGGEQMARPTIGPQANGDHIATGGLASLNVFADHPGTVTANPGTGGAAGAPGATGGQAGGSPFSGYAAFINSPFFQFPYQTGMNALNNGLASRGLIESGDAIKEAQKFGQNLAFTNGLTPFLGLAGDQANRGVQSAGAIAGVGLNALNNMTANNANAGNVAAQAQIARGAANAGMYSNIGSALGGLAGAAFPSASSYGASSGPIVSNYHYTGAFG
jgi:hypothetical protein